MARDIRDIPVDHGPISAHYELLEIIGEGAFGKVVLGEHMLTKAKVAVKMIDQQVCKKMRRSLLHEVRCMEELHHPNIVQLLHVISSPEHLFLVMEFVPGGDMLEYLRVHGCMSETMARGVFRQLVSAVHYCHQKGVAHRDLKPQNVLLDSDMNAKIIDFGLGVSSNIHQLNTFCGSILYAAPELFLGKIYNGCATDTWSLGVMLHQMLTDTIPFEDVSWEELLDRLGCGQYDIPSYLSIEVQTLLRKLLTPKPENRHDLRNIMPDPWLNMEHGELQPYDEPRRDIIEPRVVQQMVTLGFQEEDIKDTLAKHRYNNILATYSILQRQSPRFACRTIHVKPCHPPELQSCSPSPDQEGQPEWSGSQKAEQQPADDKTGQKAQETGGPDTMLEPTSTITEVKTTIRPSGTGGKTASPEPRNTTTKLSTRRYCWGSRTATQEHQPGSRNTTTEHNQGSGTATLEHRPGSSTSTPAHRPGSRTATAGHRPGKSNATVVHRPDTSIATGAHRPGTSTAAPEHTPGTSIATGAHRPGTSTAAPEHRPGTSIATGAHRPCTSTTTAVHRQGTSTATPEHRPGASTTTPLHRPGTSTATSEHRTGSRTSIPELIPCSSTTIPSLAPQCHRVDSVSIHSSTTSCGKQEGNKQRRWRISRRCWNIFRKIFCLPPKTGYCKPNQVKPL